MKATVLRYGLYSILVLVVLGLGQLLISKNLGYDAQEIAGYLSILLAMIFVFLGIRHFRDRYNGGQLSFVQGLKLGTLITILPSVAFGLFDIIYTRVINPGWMDEYYRNYEEKLRATVAPDQLEAALEKAVSQKEFFSNPMMEFLLMGGTVFVIGLIVTIISTLALRRSNMATV